MKRKDYNLVKSEIRRLLKELDNSFEPSHVYDVDSEVYRTACNLRYVVRVLSDDLVGL